MFRRIIKPMSQAPELASCRRDVLPFDARAKQFVSLFNTLKL